MVLEKYAPYLFIYLSLAALGLCCCAQAFSSCSERGLLFVAVRRLQAHRLQQLQRVGLSGCGTWAQLLRGMWDLPRPGIKPVSPALPGGFVTTAPPGKSPEICSLRGSIGRYFSRHVDDEPKIPLHELGMGRQTRQPCPFQGFHYFFTMWKKIFLIIQMKKCVALFLDISKWEINNLF